MNSASSALMILIFVFLAKIRKRHATYTRKCLNAIFLVDTALEEKLRSLSGDTPDNNLVVIPAPKVNRIQRAVFYYADFIGTLIYIVILLSVVSVWLAVGPVLHFSDNRWLISGTYVSPSGMNDDFGLRNLQHYLGGLVTDRFRKVYNTGAEAFRVIGLPVPEGKEYKSISFSIRISETINRICGHEFMVVASLLLISGLIVGASAM